ncbi:MAG: prolyl oligopeptidase family serine peptidase [Cryomorphaceae bacterium]|jgi:predicted peptidase|nr:prolyl oligopeptidase family serine peptidase [Cryomorphaceae bacterium]
MIKRGFNFALFIMLFLTGALSAQVQAVYNKSDYNFWISLPADSILKSKPPILIFLHGKSLSGSDLNMVRRYGVIHEIDKGRNFPAIVVAPQVLYGKSWEPKKIKKVLEYVQSQYVTDSSRVYVTGMSLGGYGTLNFAGTYPELVAAAVALCGGGNVKDAYNLSQVPLWIQHGNRDSAVPISESEKIVKAITECEGGENLKYTVVQGANHGDLEKVFRTDEIYDWMFQYSKAVEKVTNGPEK